MILEKVWAKINQTYEQTILGYASEAFFSLTPGPVEFYNHKQVEHIWKQIKEADERNYIICCSAGKPDLSSEDYSKIGLVSDHAYSVISAYEVESEGGQIKLLKLRNPWGHKEWMGDWSDKSTKWTPQLKEQLKVIDEDDGIFFICYEDYMNYYRSTTIAKVHDGYSYNFAKAVQ